MIAGDRPGGDAARERPFPVEIELPIQWGDQDALGHVNNVIFFRYFESGRIAYFERVGLDRVLDGRSVGPILARATCDFLAPLHYPDRIRVGVRVDRIGRSSFTMQYVITSQSRQTVCARGEGVMVMYDYEAGASRPLDPELRARIEEVEG